MRPDERNPDIYPQGDPDSFAAASDTSYRGQSGTSLPAECRSAAHDAWGDDSQCGKGRKGKRLAPGPDPAGPSQKMQRVDVSAADWYCHQCDHLNFARRTACQECAAQRRYSAADLRPGDWICGECNNHNFARNEFCRVCSTRPKGKGKKGGPIGKGKLAETFKGKAKVDDKGKGKSKTKGKRPTSVPSLRGKGPFSADSPRYGSGAGVDATPRGSRLLI
jgi:hypothetical protein